MRAYESGRGIIELCQDEIRLAGPDAQHARNFHKGSLDSITLAAQPFPARSRSKHLARL